MMLGRIAFKRSPTVDLLPEQLYSSAVETSYSEKCISVATLLPFLYYTQHLNYSQANDTRRKATPVLGISIYKTFAF